MRRVFIFSALVLFFAVFFFPGLVSSALASYPDYSNGYNGYNGYDYSGYNNYNYDYNNYNGYNNYNYNYNNYKPGYYQNYYSQNYRTYCPEYPTYPNPNYVNYWTFLQYRANVCGSNYYNGYNNYNYGNYNYGNYNHGNYDYGNHSSYSNYSYHYNYPKNY